MSSQQPAPDTRNWKLIQDPSLKKEFSHKLYRYDGTVPNHPVYNVSHLSDPRSLASRLFSRNERIDLPLPVFLIDENYTGRPPLRELAFFDLNDNVSENFLTDMCKKCGAPEEVKVFYHSTTKRHLGVARVVYRLEKEATTCLERYNGTSVMGKTVKVVPDPRGSLAKEAVDRLVNKTRNSQDQTSSNLRNDKLPVSSNNQITSSSSSVTPSLPAKQPVTGTKPDAAGHGYQVHSTVSATSTSSPSVCLPPVPNASSNGTIPDDPTSNPVTNDYGSLQQLSAHVYSTPWPPVAAPVPWPTAGVPWPQWPIPMPATYGVAPPLPDSAPPAVPPGTDIATSENGLEQTDYSRKRSHSPNRRSKAQGSSSCVTSKRNGNNQSSRPSSRAEKKKLKVEQHHDHESSGRRRKSHASSSAERNRNRSISPLARPFRSGKRDAEKNESGHPRFYDQVRKDSPPNLDRRRKHVLDMRNERSKKRCYGHGSRSRSRNRRSGFSRRSSLSGGSDTDSGRISRSKHSSKRDPVVESVEEEEEYYRRSRTSSQQTRRPTSRLSNRRTSVSKERLVVSRGESESHRSLESEYCNEVEEYEYYRRKTRQRRIVQRRSSSKSQRNASKNSDGGQPLEDKFEAITSSEEDNGCGNSKRMRRRSKERALSRSSKRRNPSSSATARDISPPFGKLERISCTSEGSSEENAKIHGNKRRKISNLASKQRQRQVDSRRHRRPAHERSSSSSSESSSASSSDHRKSKRNQYHSRKNDSRKEKLAIARETKRGDDAAVVPEPPVCARSKMENSANGVAPVNAYEAPGSLETRIQQLLGGEHLAIEKNVDEANSTPVQDEHNIANLTASHGERTSDVEMSLSSGDEDQSYRGRDSRLTKEKIGVVGAPCVNHVNTGMAPNPAYYCAPAMFVYATPTPNFVNTAPPVVPPLPVGPPPPYAMWTTSFNQPANSASVVPPSQPQRPTEERCQQEKNKISTPKDCLRLTEASVAEVRSDLKTVLQRDIVKRALETSLFQSVDSWFMKEEFADKKKKEHENESNNYSQLVRRSTVQSDTYQMQSPLDITPSFTGVSGFGISIRASMPKLPSFKRKIRPITPPSPSPSPRRVDESESSETSKDESESSESSSEEEEDQAMESSKSSGDESVHCRPSNRSRRLRTESSASVDSNDARTGNSSQESDSKRRSSPLIAKKAPVVDSDYEDDKTLELAQAKQLADEKRIEPISDEEIDDEREEVGAAKPDVVEPGSETAEAVSSPLDRLDKDKYDVESDAKINDTHQEDLPPVTKESTKDLKSPRKRRGRKRVVTATEDEVSGGEADGDVASKTQIVGVTQTSTETHSRAQECLLDRPDGSMFVDDGCIYVPNEFDHHYTLLLGKVPVSPVSQIRHSTIPKPRESAAEKSSIKKTKTPTSAPKPPKPAPPAITFKPRLEADDLRICGEFLSLGIDEEDISYLKMVCDKLLLDGHEFSEHLRWAPHPATANPPYKRLSPDEIPSHSTGCARTQGFYRLSHKEKRRISKPRQALEYYTEAQNQQIANLAKQQVQFNREARSMQRRLLATLGSEVDSDLLKYNQLRFRKKHIKFARSTIHGWGLFAMEDIAQDEMIVEYVGEKIRITVAEKREKKYEKMGVGSSYLFRIDNDNVIDATKRGNIARFINHSCNPNCYARIISLEAEKHIVIYSKQVIRRGDEITYDYKFPLEDEKIPCNCGAPCCRGTLN